MRSYYEILGVSKDSTLEQIKNAFREKAKATHPDMHGGDPSYATAFNEVAEAYAILSDTAKRAQYDELLTSGYSSTYEDMGGNATTTQDLYEYVSRFMSETTVAAEKAKKEALSAMYRGLLWLALGLIITFGSYALASKNGGSYRIMYGAIIVGGWQAIKSFNNYSKIKDAIEEYKKNVWNSFFS